MWNLFKFFLLNLKFFYFLARNANFQSEKLAVDFNEERNKLLLELRIAAPRDDKKDGSPKEIVKMRLSRNYVTAAFLHGFAFINQRLHKKDKNIFLLPRYKAAYIRIAKAGSTSILSALLQHRKLPVQVEIAKLSDLQINVVADYLMTNQNNEAYELFTVVRNPLTRILSVYNAVFKADRFIYHNYLFGILNPRMSFAEFIEAIARIPDVLKDQHFKPQHLVINEHMPVQKVKIYKLEHLTGSELRINDLTIHLPHRNKQVESYRFEKLLTRKTAERIYEIYKQDFEIFRYELDFEAISRRLEK